jgi:hypothetical protein
VRALDESSALFESVGLTSQALRSRCLKVVVLLESGRDDDARRAAAGIGADEIDTPLLARLLKAGVMLALDVSGTDEQLDAVVPHIAKLLAGVEVLPPAVDRCLRCAVARAHAAGSADRAARIEALGATVPPPRS